LFDGLRIYFLPIVLVMVVFVTGRAFGWPWSTDMMYQPSIKPYEEPLPYPDLSITNKGIRVVPIIPREEFEEMTVNPVSPDKASLENGEALFKNFCVVCHGPEGKGDGPVIKKGFYPVNLTAPPTQARTDGFLYAYIRFGGKVMMPSYRESISEKGAWDVVNYVRKLQGKLN
jgi:S-disulfanyl-L-cysteine oxidoreductase SoxD